MAACCSNVSFLIHEAFTFFTQEFVSPVQILLLASHKDFYLGYKGFF